MKKLTILPAMLLAFATIFLFQACDEDLPTNYSFDPYEFSSLDENGGQWVPNLLTSSSQIGIPAPTDAGSAEFQAELAALKTLSAQLTSERIARGLPMAEIVEIERRKIKVRLFGSDEIVPGDITQSGFTVYLGGFDWVTFSTPQHILQKFPEDLPLPQQVYSVDAEDLLA